MPTIKAGCTKCGKAFGVLEQQLGTEVQCPHCKARMKIPKLNRPTKASSGAASALDDAAAQLGLPGKPKPPGDGLDDLLAATQQKPAARHEQVESRPAHGHTAGHSHLDSSEDELPARPPTGLMKNPGVVFTLAGVLLLIIVVFFYVIMTNKNGVSDQTIGDGQTQADGPMTAAKSAAMAAVLNKVGPGARGPAPTSESATPLTMDDSDKGKPDEYFELRKQLPMVHFAMFQNTTNDLVERAAATISVWDGKKMLVEKTFIFRDVQPGQKVPAIIAYPYTDAKLKFETKWRHWAPGKPVYKIAATFLGVRGHGDSGGTVTVEVRNDNEVAAPMVDVTVILMDTKSLQRSGYVTATVRDLKPHEGRNVEIPWEGFESDSISGGDAYAQIGGAETE